MIFKWIADEEQPECSRLLESMYFVALVARGGNAWYAWFGFQALGTFPTFKRAQRRCEKELRKAREKPAVIRFQEASDPRSAEHRLQVN
jgi:hypothetical protein